MVGLVNDYIWARLDKSYILVHVLLPTPPVDNANLAGSRSPERYPSLRGASVLSLSDSLCGVPAQSLTDAQWRKLHNYTSLRSMKNSIDLDGKQIKRWLK